MNVTIQFQKWYDVEPLAKAAIQCMTDHRAIYSSSSSFFFFAKFYASREKERRGGAKTRCHMWAEHVGAPYIIY